MSASYTLLVPLMLVSSISYLLLRNTSLYEKQQISRIASPAHLTEFARGMLEKIRVHEAVQGATGHPDPGEHAVRRPGEDGHPLGGIPFPGGRPGRGG